MTTTPFSWWLRNGNVLVAQVTRGLTRIRGEYRIPGTLWVDAKIPVTLTWDEAVAHTRQLCVDAHAAAAVELTDTTESTQ